MRIFVDIRPLSAKIISGIPEYTRFLVKGLTENYPNEEYLFFANKFGKQTDPFLPDKSPSGRIVDYGIPNKIWDATNRFLNLPKIDKLVKADVYLSSHIDILSFKNPQKHVMTIHDLSFVFYKELFTWEKNFWHWRQNYEKQIREAGRIVAVSEFTRQTIMDHFRVDGRKVIRIYPGVNPFYQRLARNDENLAKFRKDKNLDRPFILHVGTLEPRKNAIGVIRAFNLIKEKKQFSELKLVLVGARGWLFEKVLSEAERSPVREDILFWGRATEQELLSLYNLASAFVYPSFFEGFAFPCLEAQTCGTPVVASDRGPLPEVLGKSAITVNPWKVHEIKMAMETVLSHNKKREELSEAGLKNAKRFSWTETVRKIMETLKETL